MVRFALFAVAAVVLSVLLQTGQASAKLCQPELRFAPYPPVAGQETTLDLSIRSLDDEREFDDPLCAIDEPPDGEAALRLYMVPPGMPNAYAAIDFRQPGVTVDLPVAENGNISYEYLYPDAPFVDLERIDPWRLRASTTFAQEGRWDISVERLQPDYTPIWRSSVEVLSAAPLPPTGGGDVRTGGQAGLLAYVLAILGGAGVLAAVALRRLGRART